MLSSSSKTQSVADKPKYTNGLINEKSPYLLQHAHNPVQWYPWGPEAIEKAKVQKKLIFLSVGYSTCHWCHVMEKESFENENVAKMMNDHYINIKVDREERPDIDLVYLSFVIASTGNGSWPMSVFLTPDLQPVSGGTYFPPEDRWGHLGFKTALLTLAKKWKENPQQCLEVGQHVIIALQQLSVDDNLSTVVLEEGIWDKCVRKYMLLYETEFGGFGMAPKFPHASILNFHFHYYARDKSNPDGKKCLEMCLYTLTKIAKGAVHDHVCSGFARYSDGNDWHVHHFEKMLYDQAQLVVAYTDAFLATKDEFYADVVYDIIKYVNRDLRHESGGYFSAEDSDSFPTFETTYKKEGAFCLWEYNELKELLNDKKINDISYLEIFCEYFSINEEGNISPITDLRGELVHKNALMIYDSKEEIIQKFNLSTEEFNQVIKDCIKIVYDARKNRPRPDLDTKMLCSWNGLMLSALAQAGQGLGENSFVDDAIKTAYFIKKYLYDVSTTTLLHSCYRDDNGDILKMKNPIKAFLDDYAFLIKGLLDLYEASFDRRWLNWARELQLKQNDMFWDSKDGGYFTCSTEDKTIVLRLKEDHDGAEPSGNSVSCHNLLRLAAHADKSDEENSGEKKRDMAKKILVAFAKRLNDSPTALPEMMSALMFYNDSPTKVLISGGRSDPRTLEMVRAVRTRLLPGRVLCVADPADTPAVLHHVKPANVGPRAHVCRRYACSLPLTDVKQLENLLDETPAAVAKK